VPFFGLPYSLFQNTTGVTRMKKQRFYFTQEIVAGYVFIFPLILIYALFMIIPVFSTFGISLTKYRSLTPPEFIGLNNYIQLFQDVRMGSVFFNTVFFTIMSVLGNVGGGLLLALLLNRKMPKVITSIFRSTFFLPVIIGYVYVAIVWRQLYATDVGIFNYYFGELGLGKVGWLTNEHVVMFSIIIMDIWKNAGYFMVIFLAGLQNIPGQCIEAAIIDGAKSRQILNHITLPLLTPTIFFNVVWCSINALQAFEAMYILTQGGPGDASRSIVIYIYENAFKKFNLGYASSMAVVLFVLISVLTFMQFRFSRKWVNYR
jgi:multiple sugar transport system permease protein